MSSTPAAHRPDRARRIGHALAYAALHGAAANPAAPAAWALIGAAIALRAAAFLHGHSLWLDEAMLSLNIGARSFRELLEPLDYRQAAPFPFLWAARAVTRIGGVNEQSLRTISLACGIAGIVATWLVGRRILSIRIGLVALALAVTSHPLARYSLEVKQYSLDFVVTLALLGLGHRVLEHPTSAGRWHQLGAGGVLGLTCSYPALFVLAGVASALPVHPAVRTSPHWFRRWCLTVAVWGAAFGAMYALLHGSLAHDPELQRMWSRTFPTLGAPDFWPRAGTVVRAVLTAPLGHLPEWAPMWALSGLFVSGVIVAQRRRGWSVVMLLCVPFMALAAAAMLGRYPIAPRLVLFTGPLTLFAYAAACVAMTEILPIGWRRRTLAVVVLTLVVARGRWAPKWPSEPEIEDARSVVKAVERIGGGEPIYVMRHAIPEWTFYTTDWRRPDLPRLQRVARIYTFAAPAGGLTPVHRFAGGELLSTPLGVRWTQGIGWGGTQPDSAWSNGDARRIREAARPGIWLFVTQFEPSGAHKALITAVEAEGGRVVCSLGAKRAGAFRIWFGEGEPVWADRDQASGSRAGAPEPASGGSVPLIDAAPPC